MTPAHYRILTEAEWDVVPGPRPLLRTMLCGVRGPDEIRVIDGGDTGCGELLMRMRKHVSTWDAGTVVRLVSTDPGARDDLPAWCRMVGHAFRGTTVHDDGRPAFDFVLGHRPRKTNSQT